jgi:hypothetical protein
MAIESVFDCRVRNGSVALSILQTQRFETVPYDDYREMNISHRAITALYIDEGGVLVGGYKKGIEQIRHVFKRL